MFTTPAPSAPTLSTTTSPASPTSPTRPLRLRGLSYLRNYTHVHLHPHSTSTSSTSSRPNIGRSRCTPSPSTGGPDNETTTSTPPTPSTLHLPTPHFSTTTSGGGHTASSASGWVPIVAGQSGLSRISTLQQSSDSSAILGNTLSSTMTRNRSETAAPQPTVRNHGGPTPANMDGDDQTDGASPSRPLPSIRFIPHHDARATRPSLMFPTITRTLPDENAIIRVGRYSERDNIPDVPPNVPSSASVGFKSKVVSRKHCEFWCSNSQWYIKDVKSSSGTFLNHIRLSQPNVESKPFKVKDGDVVQLGIDFRGGEEMIFRCVKIRIECNRGWQQGLNNFNKQTHQRLRNLAKAKKDSDAASAHSSECSICLMSIAPCQSLFVAPCSHVWHYKCIRPILNGPTWPNFLCPNCRAVTDLEADVEEPNEYENWDEEEEEEAALEKSKTSTNEQKAEEAPKTTPHLAGLPIIKPEPATATARTPHGGLSVGDLEAAISTISIQESSNNIASQTTPPPQTSVTLPSISNSNSIAQPVPITNGANSAASTSGLFPGRSTSDDSSVQYALSPERAPECPMTPRNDAGPFVFDGSAGRTSGPVRRSGDEPASPTPASVPVPGLHINARGFI